MFYGYQCPRTYIWHEKLKLSGKEVSSVTLSLSHQGFRIIIQRGTSEVGHLSF